MLEASNGRTEVVTLFQPNVSIAFGKQHENLALKVAQLPKLLFKRVNTCTRCSLWALFHFETGQHSDILNSVLYLQYFKWGKSGENARWNFNQKTAVAIWFNFLNIHCYFLEVTVCDCFAKFYFLLLVSLLTFGMVVILVDWTVKFGFQNVSSSVAMAFPLQYFLLCYWEFVGAFIHFGICWSWIFNSVSRNLRKLTLVGRNGE